MTLRAAEPTPIPPPPPGAAAGPAPILLPISQEYQKQPNWCWATCCQMEFNYKGPRGLEQCDLASKLFGGACCTTLGSDDCNKPAWPDDAYAAYGYQAERLEQAVPFATIQAEVQAGRPVEIYLLWDGGASAHVVLVTGYYPDGELAIIDPAPDGKSGKWNYDQIQAAFNLGQWQMTWTGISP